MKWLRRATAAVAVLPLLVHSYMGTYSRYIADDYCTIASLRRFGFWGSQTYWYSNWSGRFAFAFLVNALELLGSWVVPILPAAALLAWFAALALGLHFALGGALWLRTATLAGLVLTVTLAASPNVYQSIYWQTGLATYAMPLLLLTGVGALIAWRSRSHSQAVPLWLLLALVLLTSFFAGGLSETSLSLQISAFALAVVLAGMFAREGRAGLLSLAAAGLIGSFLALVVVLSAPGNEIRIGLMEQPPSLLTLLAWTLRDSRLFVLRSLSGNRIVSLSAIIIPTLMGLRMQGQQRNSSRAWMDPALRWFVRVAVIGVLTGLLICASIAPSLYATSNYPVERALLVPQYVLTIGLALIGSQTGMTFSTFIHRNVAIPNIGQVLAIAVLVALVIPVWIESAEALANLPQARTYVSMWSDRDRRLREAGNDPVEVVEAVSLPHMGGLAEIGYDSAEWINVCLADAYDLAAVVAK